MRYTTLIFAQAEETTTVQVCECGALVLAIRTADHDEFHKRLVRDARALVKLQDEKKPASEHAPIKIPAWKGPRPNPKFNVGESEL